MMRPRFGVMRCREFAAEDAYSFDADEDGAEKATKCLLPTIIFSGALRFAFSSGGGGFGQYRRQIFP